MEEIVFTSPAKVNLFLEVLGKREDGFHEIETVMMPVGLYDFLFFRKKASGIDVYCDPASVPSGPGNIVFKAVKLLLGRTGVRGGLEVRIRKEIPAGSGLGGGSGNAAAALSACCLLFGLGLEKEDLLLIGREAGSDVPFFIKLLDETMTGFAGGVYSGRGRGDELSFAGNLPGFWMVIVFPGIRIPTGEAYGDLRLTGKRRDITMILNHLSSGDAAGVSSCLFNRFEDGAGSRHPRIKDIKEDLLRAGAAGALMTGSGSAVFGTARDENRACEIRDKILSMRRGVNAYVTCGLH